MHDTTQLPPGCMRFLISRSARPGAESGPAICRITENREWRINHVTYKTA